MTYIRWGRTVCPQGTSLLYTGVTTLTSFITSNLPSKHNLHSYATECQDALPYEVQLSQLCGVQNLITLTKPICPAHYATRMRRRLPSCIQHDSTAHKDGMRNTLGTWQHNCRALQLRRKTQSVWIKTPYQYQGVVQT